MRAFNAFICICLVVALGTAFIQADHASALELENAELRMELENAQEEHARLLDQIQVECAHTWGAKGNVR